MADTEQTGPAFSVEHDGEAWTATTDDPELAEVVWTWHGGAYIEYGLPGQAVDAHNVWDYETDRADHRADRRGAGGVPVGAYERSR